ncbi:VOC family protein [Alkalicoccus halolimnae]|uniref:VOC family protein n=1 Tax=Alkalicoccus halolimnae TaxID=1667239 RepID=A0A5C7FFQ5_9BACI|nr:VOC family protein [Alkalicoccus halolimnae]TXF86137.1 VOC family protein [Alkalicoccus halolimnae]
MGISTQKIVPSLWFDSQAEEAAKFYCSIFEDSAVTKTRYYGESGPGPAGSVMVVEFELEGQPFIGLNGGPHFTFNPAVSFTIHCSSQEEVDYYWNKLLVGGREDQCGWLQDQFGLSWQVVPDALTEMLQDENAEKAQAAMQAMLQMKKIIIADVEKSYKEAG